MSVKSAARAVCKFVSVVLTGDPDVLGYKLKGNIGDPAGAKIEMISDTLARINSYDYVAEVTFDHCGTATSVTLIENIELVEFFNTRCVVANGWLTTLRTHGSAPRIGVEHTFVAPGPEDVRHAHAENVSLVLDLVVRQVEEGILTPKQ